MVNDDDVCIDLMSSSSSSSDDDEEGGWAAAAAAEGGAAAARRTAGRRRTASCKAKGRVLQQAVCRDIVTALPTLGADDVRSTSMSAGGEDVLLSPRARAVFPFAVECKNRETLPLWQALMQAARHSRPGAAGLLVFTRRRAPTYAALPWPDFLALVARAGRRAPAFAHAQPLPLRFIDAPTHVVAGLPAAPTRGCEAAAAAEPPRRRRRRPEQEAATPDHRLGNGRRGMK